MSFITAKNISLSVDDNTRHWFYFTSSLRSDAERAASIHEDDMGGATVMVDQPIHNGREENLKLDDASFELVSCPTKLSTEDYYKVQTGEGDAVERCYKEVEDFVAAKLGCDKVVCVHSQVRNAAKLGTDGIQGYAVGGPHTDTSPVSTDVFCLDTLKKNGLDGSQYKRYCHLNLWRNIGQDPIQNNHLACLDERTVVKPDDYICKDLIADGYEVVQYGLNAKHKDQHKWYYFPNMTRDEAILFKQMDSDWTKSGRLCFHMAVDDATCPPTAPDRESIEIRMFCFWKEADHDSMPTAENIHKKMLKNPRDYAIQLKQGNGGGSLASASLLQLMVAILAKLPLIGSFFGAVLKSLSSSSTGSAAGTVEYSGNPQDYADRFVSAVNAYDSWPGFAKAWVKNTMQKPNGIEELTKAMVDDAMGYQKTKNLSREAKADIYKHLMGLDEYKQACEKHLAPLAPQPNKE